MTKRMLIDATHAEETRVVVLDGNRLDDFDVETASKKQLKGNIYLAKVVRVEPSLQAAFVEYGGNRHGFLAFSEIHPDYYQIPVADRQRLLDMQEEDARAEEEDDDDEAERHTRAPVIEGRAEPAPPAETLSGEGPELAGDALPADAGVNPESLPEAHQPQDDGAAIPALRQDEVIRGPVLDADSTQEPIQSVSGESTRAEAAAQPAEFGADLVPEAVQPEEVSAADAAETASYRDSTEREPGDRESGDEEYSDSNPDSPPPETVGGETEEGRERRQPPRFMRNYKIQEVIRRRQIMLIQVVKEERGSKGAALTTYISLAGRYSVLMPNSPRGGGISRKITSASDRKRLKEVMTELDIPKGMGLIVRTAGAQRPKPEIKRDCEYLLRLWDDIREHTMRSVAPALIYEEANLIKRAIRDVYSRDIDEVQVDGEEGWKAARDFMRMLMPSHVKNVHLWRGPQKLFSQVETQLESMLSPTVQLRSGGYLVINQAEALVAIDVNSGRSTRERNIEETALRTNLEAAEEVARQLRLRDLAGLVVIDFIDMESRKNNAAVERKIKEALKSDRARIQVGQISHFGLLEMSRQRLRPSLAETSFIACPHCAGTGLVRSTDSAAMHVLRQVEEEGAKRRAAEIIVHVAGQIALYILNQKREWLSEIEQRFAMRVAFEPDATLMAPQIRIDRIRAAVPAEHGGPISQDTSRALAAPAVENLRTTQRDSGPDDWAETDQPDIEPAPRAEPVAAAAGPQPEAPSVPAAEAGSQTPVTGEDAERRRRRRRRRRRGGRRDEQGNLVADANGNTDDSGSDEDDESEEGEGESFTPNAAESESTETVGAAEDIESAIAAELATGADVIVPPVAEDETAAERGRRGRRGGRRRRRDPADEAPIAEEPVIPAYVGPTPADPFGGQGFDIFDIIEAQEARLAAAAVASARESAPVAQAPEPVAAVVAEPIPAAPALDSAPDSGSDSVAPAVIESRTVPETESIPPAPVEATLLVEPVQPEPVQAEPAKAEPAQPEAVVPEPEAESAPAIKPTLVDGEPPATERKRGWWRR